MPAETALCRYCGWGKDHHDPDREDAHKYDPEPLCIGCGKTQAECHTSCGARCAGCWER